MILKNITLSLIFAFTLFAFTSNATEQKTEKTISTFDFQDFNSLEVNHAIAVNLIQADEYKIVIEHDEKLQDLLQVELNGNVLILDLKNGYNYNNVEVTATIHMPNVSKIKLSGASTLLTASINSDDLEITLSGASDMVAEIMTEVLVIDASGASTAKLSGKTSSFKGSCSGASDLKAKNLTVSTKCDLKASGASDLKITNNGVMSVSLSGASACTYYGDGTIKSQSVNGASSIRKGK